MTDAGTTLFETGKSLFEDEKYAEAKEAFLQVLSAEGASSDASAVLEGLSKKAKMWARKCDLELAKNGGVETTTVNAETEAEKRVEEKKQEAETATPVAVTPTPAAPAAKPKSAIRHDWFQSLGNITLSFFVKGRTSSDVEVHVEPKCFDITVKLDGGNTFTYSFDPLYAEVDPESVKIDVRSIKIEVSMNKKVQAQWAALEAPEGQMAAVSTTASSTASTGAAKAGAGLPKPYSGKAKDWSKEVEYEDDKPEGEAATNAFFKEIYGGAGADQQRAMMKSFQESGGTVLSTNWADVGSKKVEVQAPNGMEARKWEQ